MRSIKSKKFYSKEKKLANSIHFPYNNKEKYEKNQRVSLKFHGNLKGM